MPRTAASFSHVPAKTAERKEIGKLKRSNKKVMFSVDLENSQSSGRSSTMSGQSIGDISYAPSEPTSPARRLNRMLSEDSAIELPDRLSRSGSNSWLRRSADNLKWLQNGDKHYNQLPSNQIKFGSNRVSQDPPMSSNIKTYLNTVMERTRHNSLNESLGETCSRSGTLRSTGSNDVFTLPRNYYPSCNSRDTDSTTTSGSYHLGPQSTTTSGSYHLGPQPFTTSVSFGSDSVFAEDIDV